MRTRGSGPSLYFAALMMRLEKTSRASTGSQTATPSGPERTTVIPLSLRILCTEPRALSTRSSMSTVRGEISMRPILEKRAREVSSSSDWDARAWMVFSFRSPS